MTSAAMFTDMDDVLICRCEEIRVADARAMVRGGAHSVNDVKRRARAGMGVCQGIYCMPAIAQLIHEETGAPLASILPMTARPPARVIPLAALANVEE